MKKIIKILCIVIASLILISGIVFGVISCNKNINLDKSELNDINDNLLKLKSDTWDIEVNTYKDVLFQVTVSETVKCEIVLMDENNTKIGILADDGTNGDKIAGDSIYSGFVKLFSSKQEIKKYYCRCGNVKSNEFEISFYKKLTTHDYELVNEIRDKIKVIERKYTANVDGSINESSAKEVYNEIINYFNELKENGILESYENIDGEMTLNFTNGVTMDYTFNLKNDETWGSINYDGNNNTLENKLNKTELDLTETRGNKSILTLEPFEHYDVTNATDKCAEIISNNYYKFVSNLDNEQVTIETMKNLANYNIIIATTHGGFCSRYGTRICTGEADTEENFLNYSADIVSERITVSQKYNCYTITPKFFDKYYEDDSFNDTLIYLGVCHSADDSRLADMLIKKGVDVVLGYKNSVSTEYETKMSQTFFNLLYKSKDALPINVEEAFKESKEINGKKDTQYSNLWTYLFEKTGSKFAELKLFGNYNYDLLGDMGCVTGQCVDNEDGMCIFATNNVYRISDDKSRELYCSNSDSETSNIKLILPPDKYILEIIPKSSIYESKEISLDVKSNRVINLNNINFDKKVVTTSKPVNSTTYVNKEYGWSVELPEEWKRYGSVGEYAGGFKHTILGQVGFHHKEIQDHDSSPLHSNNMGWVFDIGALPHDEYEEYSKNHPRIGKLAENSDYVFFWTGPTDLRVDPNSSDFERLHEEYNILYNTRDSILESFKLLN